MQRVKSLGSRSQLTHWQLPFPLLQDPAPPVMSSEWQRLQVPSHLAQVVAKQRFVLKLVQVFAILIQSYPCLCNSLLSCFDSCQLKPMSETPPAQHPVTDTPS